jgi:hypothetical protein
VEVWVSEPVLSLPEFQPPIYYGNILLDLINNAGNRKVIRSDRFRGKINRVPVL